MKHIRVLDETGDSETMWDDTEANAAAKEIAKAAFANKKGAAVMTKRADGKPDQIIRKFEEIEDQAEVIFIPAIVAG